MFRLTMAAQRQTLIHFSMLPGFRKHLLGAKGVTQTDLHRATGIPKSTISEVLAGKKPFSRQMIRKLAAYFQVNMPVLTGNL